MPSLDPLAANEQNGMVFGTNRSRLALAMDNARTPEDVATFSESTASFARYRESAGVDNPWGTGLAAYEPGTVIFDEYRNAHDRVAQSKQDDALTAAQQTYTTIEAPGGGAPLGNASGKIGAAISAAMDLANRRVPYVWGGTTRNGVDCSGLIYYAFRAAGIDTKRYRAVDYGRMGQAVTLQDARPGDVVYIDNRNSDTDHVGIYIGNGKMIQAPQSGDVVRVTNVGNFTSIRRIFEDDAFTQVATPEGGSFWGYGPTARTFSAPTSPARSAATIARTSPWRRGQIA